MDRIAAGTGSMDLEQELSRADVESVSSDNTVASGTNGNVQVVVRVRPPSTRERDQGYVKCVGVDPAAHAVTLNFRPQPRTFTFDYVSDEAVGQEEIFSAVGKPITDACLQGYHCCLIAYGQTGAGKTFTMEGPDTESSSGGSPGFLAKVNLKRHEKRGLIPRILDYIFQKMASEKTQNCRDVEFVVKCSYLQIYNEQVSDLLDPGSFNLTIHEDAKAGMYVEGLQEVVVSTAEATYGVFRRGSENRHVGMTAMNLESSRSHSVFTVVVESQRRNDGGVMNRRTSRFYLVDLAGSERQKHSESAGIRLKEAGSINKSLSALGNVIKALVDISEGKIRHVPYRDSKLTFLLKDALGGNSKCTLIANVSPAEKNIDETLSTLKFAQRAKLIHNTAIVNEDMFGNPAVMGEEIRRLRLEIAALRANLGSGGSVDQSPMTCQEAQSETARTSRLEHIISQSVKRSLEAERKTEMDMHVLVLKLGATQTMCDRLEKTLQSQKMIIRLRENTIKRLESGRPSLQPDEIVHELREEIEQLRKQIEHHPDVVRFKMELDLCRGQLDEYEEERKDEELLSQIAQLENLNQTLKIEFQEMVEEKSTFLKELEEAKSSRDVGMSQLTTFEEQFVMLREAVEKYRIEAAEAFHKQEKAEEKLLDCTREQDEVWRRCNLAEAQATEYAQELTALRSQAEKMNVAFGQQTKLQEDIFLELQKATDELGHTRGTVASLQTELEESNLIRAQVVTQLNAVEEENAKTTRSLEKMVTSCGQLSHELKGKEGTHLDMLCQLELHCKELNEKVSSLSFLKAEVEESRDAAICQKEDLTKALAQLTAENVQAVEEERIQSSEKLAKLRSEMHNEVQQISCILQSKVTQLEDLEKLTGELRHQLDTRNAEVLVHKLDIRDTSCRLESSEAQVLSLIQDKSILESKIVELEQISSLLSVAKGEREETDSRLSKSSMMLAEAERNLEALTAEHETLKSTSHRFKDDLLEMDRKFCELRREHDELSLETQIVQSELAQKSSDLEAATHQKLTLDACLSEELLRTAAAEKHIKELMETVDELKADVAAMEGMKSDLLERTLEVGSLKRHAVEQTNKVALAGNDRETTQKNCTVESVVPLKDDESLSLKKIADLEEASATMQGLIQMLEEEKFSFQTTIDALQKDKQNAKAEEAALKELLLSKEAAFRISSSIVEDMKSKLEAKLEELQKLEVQILERARQIEATEKAHLALQNQHSQLVTAMRTLQSENEVLTQNIVNMEVTFQSMENSIESLKQEKVALQTNLECHFEHTEKNIISQHITEEQVKDVDISNHVAIHGETEVCLDPGTKHIDLVVIKKGNVVEAEEVETNSRYSDEQEEDRRPQEQETDARLVAALADVTDLRSDVAGCETKLNLSLKSHVQAQEQLLVAVSRAKDLEVQVALLTDNCTELREALRVKNCRNSTLESELDFCRRQEADYAQMKFQAVELGKELEYTRTLLKGVTMALDQKKTERAGFVERIAQLNLERDSVSHELEELRVAKSLVEARLSSTVAELVEMGSKFQDVDNELQLLRLNLENSVADALDNGRKLEIQMEKVDEISNKLAQAEDRLSEEHGRVCQLQRIRLDMEAQVKALVAEKVTLIDILQTLDEELFAAAGEFERLKWDLEQQFDVLHMETDKLVEQVHIQESEHGKMSKELQELIQRSCISAIEMASLKACNLELNKTVDSHTSLICSLEILVKTTVSDHEIELLALTRELRYRELQLSESSGQNLKITSDLQELRDEVQYNLGEVEYEFQKHVIDTEARMIELESQMKMVESEALQVTMRLSAENSKFAAMLATLEEQVVDHHTKVRTWVDNFNSLESELVLLKNGAIKMEGFDARVKQLEMELLAEQKIGNEYKDEILHLQTRLTEQAKRVSPCRWNSSSGTSSRPNSRLLEGSAKNLMSVNPIPMDDFMPKLAVQQRKRTAMLTKERPTVKPKTSYANQNKLSNFRALRESLPQGQVNGTQTSRLQNRLRSASSRFLERSKKPLSAMQISSQTRLPLRTLPNNTDEMNRPSPTAIAKKSRYNLRPREKVEEPISPPEPLRNKRRRLASSE